MVGTPSAASLAMKDAPGLSPTYLHKEMGSESGARLMTRTGSASAARLPEAHLRVRVASGILEEVGDRRTRCRRRDAIGAGAHHCAQRRRPVLTGLHEVDAIALRACAGVRGHVGVREEGAVRGRGGQQRVKQAEGVCLCAPWMTTRPYRVSSDRMHGAAGLLLHLAD